MKTKKDLIRFANQILFFLARIAECNSRRGYCTST